MELLELILDYILTFLPFLIMVILAGGLLWTINWAIISRHQDLGNERKFPRQIIMLALSLISLIALILVLPISESSRNQLIGLIGLLISGIIAFSSSTAVANLMAGILLRITKPFRTGDFIRVGDHFGRVSERGLFDTEIQSEQRELMALPNSFLISNAIITVRTSGTIISTTLSLGYDIHHSKIEALLLNAAKKSGLEDPFVHILELGNFSVTYKISGFLADVKWVLTAKSNLNRSVLEELHGENIEILSPTFMNQRPISEDKKNNTKEGKTKNNCGI